MEQLLREFGLTKLDLAPPPMAEKAFGYELDSRLVAFYWDPAEDLKYVDGQHSGVTSRWYGWVLFMYAARAQSTLWPFEFGRSERQATHHLLLDRLDRTLWAGHRDDVRAALHFVAANTPEADTNKPVTPKDLLRKALDLSENSISKEELEAQLVKYRERETAIIEEFSSWLQENYS